MDIIQHYENCEIGPVVGKIAGAFASQSMRKLKKTAILKVSIIVSTLSNRGILLLSSPLSLPGKNDLIYSQNMAVKC